MRVVVLLAVVLAAFLVLAAARTNDVDAMLDKYDDFHAAKEAEKGVVTMESGVQYKIIKKDKKHVVKPTDHDKVTIKMEGRLIDGKLYQPENEISIGIENLKTGWWLGVREMVVGDVFEFYIPYQHAYGKNGNKELGVPPYASIILKVELVDVQPRYKASKQTKEDTDEL